MSQRIALEVFLILLLLLANGVFAMSEIALVSARKPRLRLRAQQGSRRAAAALRLAEDPDRFLSTVQIGITLIGVFAGAFGGATIAAQIDQRLEEIPALARWSEVIGVGVVVLGIGYLSLVLGELVPKRVALDNPEKVASAVAPAMALLSRLAAPAVALLGLSTRAVLRLLRVRPAQEPVVTEEELITLLRLGTKAGTIEREEREMVERVFRLGDRPVTAVMTPRIELEWLDTTRPLAELRRQVAASTHEWFPVARERIDAVTTVARGKDLWAEGLETTADLERVAREPLFVPDSVTAVELLERFRETRNHVAVVIEEFGGVEGLVTPTDILEALVGELPGQGDVEEPMVVRREDGSWSFDAATDLDEVKLRLGIEFLEGQKDSYQTIAGYVVYRLGYRATVGASFEVGDHRFEVADTDGRRIDRILVERIPAPRGPVDGPGAASRRETVE